ncbi:MAG: hypothetical protein LUF29_08980 [Oscillospiraceae bacterium]|nr:hypothetical protein [Oscillospiraceae bacterium]
MLKNKKLRILFCLMTAVMVLFAFSGCGDNSTTDEESNIDNVQIDTPETSEEGTKSGSTGWSLGLSDGDTYLSRADYYLLGDYYYTESYRVENEDTGVVTELGLDMYLTYGEEDGYSDPDGVLAIYYDDDGGEMTGYEAYIGISYIRAIISYKITDNATYYTCVCLDSSGAVTGTVWDNTFTDSETGVITYSTGSETYYSNGGTESIVEDQFTINDDGTLTLTQSTAKEYDEEGNLTNS